MDFRVRLGLAGRAQTTAIASYREGIAGVSDAPL
jgi:hypothetical protein